MTSHCGKDMIQAYFQQQRSPVLSQVIGNIALRPEACERLRKGARFLPATNAAGDPVEADLSLTVRWLGAPRS